MFHIHTARGCQCKKNFLLYKNESKIRQPQQEAPRIALQPPSRSRERIISSGSILQKVSVASFLAFDSVTY